MLLPRTKKTAKAAANKEAEDHEPEPGDVRVVDGVEYIYAKNRRYLVSPYKPTHVWIRTNMYSAGGSKPQQGREGR
jgi:hypothetical protein